MIFGKKNYSDSERGEHGLSPHGLISIFDFLTRVGFFRGGLKDINTYIANKQQS